MWPVRDMNFFFLLRLSRDKLKRYRAIISQFIARQIATYHMIKRSWKVACTWREELEIILRKEKRWLLLWKRFVSVVYA